MPRIGDTVDASLGRADFSPILRGTAQGAAAMGAGLAGLGKGAGDALKQGKEDDAAVKGAITQLEAFAAIATDPAKQEYASKLLEGLKSDESRRSEKVAVARKIEPILGMFREHSDRAFDQMLRGEALGLDKAAEGRAGEKHSFLMGEAQRDRGKETGSLKALQDFARLQADGGGPDELAELSAASLSNLSPDQQEGYKGALLPLLLQQGEAQKIEYETFDETDPATGQEVKRKWAIDAATGQRLYPVSQVGREGAGVVGIGDFNTLGVRQTTDGKIEYKSPAIEAQDRALQGDLAARKDALQSADQTRTLLQGIRDKIKKGDVNTGRLSWLSTIGGDFTRSQELQQFEQVRQELAQKLAKLRNGARVTDADVENTKKSLFGVLKGEEANKKIIGSLLNEIDIAEKEVARADQYLIENGTMLGYEVSEGQEGPKSKGNSIFDTARKFKQQGAQGVTPQPGKPPGPTSSTGGRNLQNPPSGDFRVLPYSRDQIKGFASKPGKRAISLDFNDASNKTAKGIEIVAPSDASPQEVNAMEEWAKATRDFFASHGHSVPIRRGNGVKRGGRGKKGVIHTEPFFAADSKARAIIAKHGDEYGKILAGTLGRIPGATFIPPHEKKGQGAVSGGISEREFALRYIIPHIQG